MQQDMENCKIHYNTLLLCRQQVLCSLWHNLRQGNIHNRITDFAFVTLLIRSLSMVTNLTKPYKSNTLTLLGGDEAIVSQA